MEILSKEEILQVVRANLNGDEFNLIEFTVKSASETSLGFLGDHSRIEAHVETNGKKLTLQYFAKRIPTAIPSHKEYAEKTKAFYKEIELYKTLFLDMDDAMSFETRRKKWRPKCYFTRNWDLVVLENLTFKNYYMLPGRTYMGLAFVECSFKTLARMHGSSIVFEEKVNQGKTPTRSAVVEKLNKNERIQISDLYPNLIFESECINEPGHPGFIFWEVGIRSQAAIIDILPNYTKSEKETIKQRYAATMREAYDLVKPSSRFKNLILHADLWNNNVMFRNDVDGNVKNAVIVDFQMSRYAPPATDLLFFIYNVQDNEFRKKHSKDVFNLYYRELGETLTREGFDLESLLPRQQFDESCEYYKKYAVITIVICLQLANVPQTILDSMLKDPSQYDKFMLEDRSELMVQCFKQDELYRSRMTEAMVEFVDVCGLLDK